MYKIKFDTRYLNIEFHFTHNIYSSADVHYMYLLVQKLTKN